MIRITTQDGATVSVAGNLVGEWSALLEGECLRRLESEMELSLDLSEVKLVDEAGVESLQRLKERGVRLTRCPRVINELIGGCGR